MSYTSKEEMERLETFSLKWADLRLEIREEWSNRVKHAHKIVAARKKSGGIKGTCAMSDCGHTFHVACLGTYFNQTSSLNISEVGKYSKRKRASIAYMESTVD